MASIVTELEGYIRETQASGGQQVTVLKQVLRSHNSFRITAGAMCSPSRMQRCSAGDFGSICTCCTVKVYGLWLVSSLPMIKRRATC